MANIVRNLVEGVFCLFACACVCMCFKGKQSIGWRVLAGEGTMRAEMEVR